MQFLGLASYYRKFILHFAQIVSPLTALLRKSQEFNWTPDCTKAMEEIKKALTSPPILKYPDFSQPFYLITDASRVAVAAILSQRDPNNQNLEHPIAFSSRTLTKQERFLSAIELESLAILHGFQKYRMYLLGHFCYVITDHYPLVYLLNTNMPSGRLVKIAYQNLITRLNIERAGKIQQLMHYHESFMNPLKKWTLFL